MPDSAFKVRIVGNRILLHVYGATGSGLMLLDKKEIRHLVKLLHGKETGTVNCYNGGQVEASLELSVDPAGHHVFTAVDRAGRADYPVESTGGVMFQANCTYDGQMSQLIAELSSALAAMPD